VTCSPTPAALAQWPIAAMQLWQFLADRTIGRAFGTLCRLSSVCNVLYCGKTVRPSEKLPEGVNRKPGSKSSFFGSPPYFYFQFRRYGHRHRRFCLIFARTAQQSVLDGRNGLSSSNPCTNCRILLSELKPEVVLALDLCSVKAYFRNVVNYFTSHCVERVHTCVTVATACGAV